jgi:hypothetical protein
LPSLSGFVRHRLTYDNRDVRNLPTGLALPVIRQVDDLSEGATRRLRRLLTEGCQDDEC